MNKLKNLEEANEVSAVRLVSKRQKGEGRRHLSTVAFESHLLLGQADQESKIFRSRR
jgi:hypothetical protein